MNAKKVIMLSAATTVVGTVIFHRFKGVNVPGFSS